VELFESLFKANPLTALLNRLDLKHCLDQINYPPLHHISCHRYQSLQVVNDVNDRSAKNEVPNALSSMLQAGPRARAYWLEMKRLGYI
jgi:hypothetical protein